MKTSTRLRRSRQAGFTLIELMVALMIGGLLIMALFTIGGGTSRHFQEQQRIGTTQRSVRMAMDRLRRDIARAGYLSVPASNSPIVRVCPVPAIPRDVNAVWFADSTDDSVLPNQGVNLTTADHLRLTGNYTTGDRYIVRDHDLSGTTITLQTDWLAFRRSFNPNSSMCDVTRFQSVFQAGRMLHIETPSAYHFFVHITGSSLNSGCTEATVSINPPIPPGNPCLTGLGTGGSTVSPISEVEYRIAEATPGSALVPRNADATGVNTVLYRHELNMNNASVLPGTQRAVLEYAVDFNLDFVFDEVATLNLPPALTPILGADVDDRVQDEGWRVRAVTASLTARTPEQDPRFPWPAGATSALSANRYQVDPDVAGAARLRRATTEIFIPNMVPR